MAKVISTSIRVNNSSNVTYVLKKFDNGTYKLFTYQRNMSTGCYLPAGVKKGKC
jgi:hypothetical protein